ncbi:MAG: tyrosine-type recombinase/integrase [Litorimonas sp.]
MAHAPIKLRENTWWLRRRVPKRYQSVENRKYVHVSLHTDSKSVAESKWRDVWNNEVEAWEARLAGDTADAEKRHAAAVELAKVRGFRYMPTQDVLKLPTEAILERVEAAKDVTDAAALLGTISKPKITVKKALAMYWDLARDKTLRKSPDQIRRWENPRKKAIRNFTLVCGDKSIDEISRDDMLDFRDWWYERLAAETHSAGSANKDIGHLSGILKLVNSKKRLGLDLPMGLSELTFPEGTQNRRPPFSTEWIKTKLLAEDALRGLNHEARCILLAMVNTGARPSELTTLNEATIDLVSSIPSISVKPDGRETKSPNAVRTLPLLGVSLEAMRDCPKGFPRYFDKPGLSATINKYLGAHGLKETPDHTLYCLRHSFEDRMLEASIDVRIRKDLMGHSKDGVVYGKGASLERTTKLLAPMAL